MKQQTIRNLHRDLGYFYLGLIISFALSGIMLNHREHWHPEKYTVETRPVKIEPIEKDKVNEEFVESLGKELGIEDKFRRHNVKKGALRMSYENHDVEIDLKTGEGEVVAFKKVPLISHSIKLHKSTSQWWIYYSDIFGLSLIVIAVTGAMMIKYGKHTFSKRGWKLAVAGILFPLIFLFLLA